MYKHLLNRIAEDIDWMALLPLLLFFTVFALVIVAVMAARKSHMDYMAGLPLENDPETPESQL